MKSKKTQIITTLGPSTKTEEDLKKLKVRGVDFVRVNLSHSSLEDLEYFIKLAKKVGIPFVLDTQGSQIRTAELKEDSVFFEEREYVRLYNKDSVYENKSLRLVPDTTIGQLEVGDLIYIDFNSLVLCVTDVSTLSEGYITSVVITSGSVGKNKGVVIHSGSNKYIELPILSEKDKKAIEIGLKFDVKYIAASFMRSGDSVDKVRNATCGQMKIISKIECVDALENLDDIIEKSDYLLLDRGDLSKEIPIEKIPLTQKMILHRANTKNKPVFVATNLLETMINEKKPTRAEVHDIVATLHDGASGLVMAAETAVGKYPMECVNMLNKLIAHSELSLANKETSFKNNSTVMHLEKNDYLLDMNISSSLVPPHGGKLVKRMVRKMPDEDYLNSLAKVELDENKLMDIEQIAIGTYSPIEGFMCEDDFKSVVNSMRLANGLVWTLPIVLDVTEEKARECAIGKDIALVGYNNEIIGLLHLEEKYTFDKEDTLKKVYLTDSSDHPGVCATRNMNNILLGGKISLFKRRFSSTKSNELTPFQVRRLFEDRGWSQVVAFHTRNVIHNAHEYIQLQAFNNTQCDGLFVHPVIGKKKAGDYHAKYIIKTYEKMLKDFYPKQKVVFGTFVTYSRYAGPREAVFTALCRKNFGCSHFIVGRDHTGVKDFYSPKESHEIFKRFPDLGIEPVLFDKVFYSKEKNQYIHDDGSSNYMDHDSCHISGSQARTMFKNFELPPEWFMRTEIAQIIIDAIKKGESVFVED
jgi:pyruvate kinase